jgi:phosphoenolpyruvate synthase/pyruvate phosphate dikinase
LSAVSASDIAACGGKGASLGELLRAGFRVPRGFVLTTAIDGSPATEYAGQILAAFDGLAADTVAVRSSATVEDSDTHSFAGLFQTYLNTPRSALIETIQSCLNSATSQRVRSYLSAKSLCSSVPTMAVVVQVMVDALVSGVTLTANPITGDRDELMIEAAWGLGEALVSGAITPDNYVVSKSPLRIMSKRLGAQRTMLRPATCGRLQERDVPEGIKGVLKLADSSVIELARLCIRVENHYRRPMDIEWGIERADGEPWLLQARPLTALV